MLDIHSLMARLSKRRPIFHSEADFQHALAWLIHETMQECGVRLEYPVKSEAHNPMHLDIWLPNEEAAIELKYCTRQLALNWNDETFDLKGQSAQDTRRYDFLKDIQRLEQVSPKTGFAVLLTNDPLFWGLPTKEWNEAGDAAFRIHEGQIIQGESVWSHKASEGTKMGRVAPISLKSSYTMHWQDYWSFPKEKSGHFRYLAVSVDP
ncbi:MAG: hypothetical protein OXM03_11140 [Chloroflexota bacterium]|nr:hypothetical protein [Chloroflexota bacterium]MDE2841170.1 hypothetical protein [Chloroflexota bacterium]MDE2931405.1 hypothetical protein [Chloroflexota bacterium]